MTPPKERQRVDIVEVVVRAASNDLEREGMRERAERAFRAGRVSAARAPGGFYVDKPAHEALRWEIPPSFLVSLPDRTCGCTEHFAYGNCEHRLAAKLHVRHALWGEARDGIAAPKRLCEILADQRVPISWNDRI